MLELARQIANVFALAAFLSELYNKTCTYWRTANLTEFVQLMRPPCILLKCQQFCCGPQMTTRWIRLFRNSQALSSCACVFALFINSPNLCYIRVHINAIFHVNAKRSQFGTAVDRYKCESFIIRQRVARRSDGDTKSRSEQIQCGTLPAPT